MKSVGIITMHRVLNCGSAIQAYALQKVVESLGYKSEIIDYYYPNNYHISIRPKDNRNIIIKLIDKIYTSLNNRFMAFTFQPFYKKFYKLSPRAYKTRESIQSDAPKYDIYISGSDQIWNPRYVGEDTNFMLSFVQAGRKIAYSSSLATKDINSNMEKIYKDALSKYDAISVREELSVDYVSALSGKQAEFVLDPSMLLKPEDWFDVLTLPHTSIGEKYALVYVLGYSFDIYDYAEKLINYIQEKTGLKILLFVYSRTHRKGLNQYQTVNKISPQNFLYLIKNASLVITDSFHATATALNFSTPLYSLIKDRNSKDNRVFSLLNSVGAAEWAIEKNTAFDRLPNIDKDYSEVQLRISKLREKSIAFLQSQMNLEDC